MGRGPHTNRKRNRPGQKAYVATRRLQRNKLKRIVRSCGYAFAKTWAEQNRCAEMLKPYARKFAELPTSK